MNKLTPIVALVFVFFSLPCIANDSGEKTDDLRKYMSQNPINPYGGKDVFLEIQGKIDPSEWYPIILFFGAADDLYNCNELVTFYEKTDSTLNYRCTVIN